MGSGSSAGSTTGLSTDGTSSLMPLDDLSSTPDADHADRAAGGLRRRRRGPDQPAPVTDYSYTADVQFGRVNDLKRYTSVQRLGLVPSRKLPLIMFLGVVERPRDRRVHGGLAPEPGRRGPLRAEGLALHVPRAAGRRRRRTSTTSATPTATSTSSGSARLERTTASAGSLGGRDVSELHGSPSLVDGSR